MPIYTKVAGVWKKITTPYVKVGSTWKSVPASTEASPSKFIKVDGAWKPVYDTDLSLTTYTLAGSSVLTRTTFTASSGATSVSVKATSADPTATVSIRRGNALGTALATGTGSVGGTGGYSFSISTANNGTTSNRVVVRVVIGTLTVDYPVDITAVAASGGGGGTNVTIYYKYCSGGSSTSELSATYSSSYTVSTACAAEKSAQGNPTGWTCQGSTGVTSPTCTTTPPSPCCQVNYSECLTSITSCYSTSAGIGTVTYYYDPCASTTCSPSSTTICGVC